MTPLEKAAEEYAYSVVYRPNPRENSLYSFKAGAHFSAQHEQKRAEKLVEALTLIALTPPVTAVEKSMQYEAWKALKDYEASK